MKFNFNGLQNIYKEAWKSEDKTLAVDVEIGRGKFLFMMFLSNEDQDAKDNLYLFLGNTNRILKFKLYGSHNSGDFFAYINENDERDLVNELKLEMNAGQPFEFERFLQQLNDNIPDSLPLSAKIKTLRQYKDTVNNISPVEEHEKTVFDGPMQLERGVKKPKDKTLRKLYMYTDTDPEVVSEFIKMLKSKNMTVKWTTPDRKRQGVSIETILRR